MSGSDIYCIAGLSLIYVGGSHSIKEYLLIPYVEYGKPAVLHNIHTDEELYMKLFILKVETEVDEVYSFVPPLCNSLVTMVVLLPLYD